MPSNPNITMLWTLALATITVDQDERFRSAPREIQELVLFRRDELSTVEPGLRSENITKKK